MGAVSAAGNDLQSLGNALVATKPCFNALDETLAGQLSFGLLGNAALFNEVDHFSSHESARLDRMSQFALVAARQAIRSSGVGVESFEPGRIGVFIGNGGGGQTSLETGYDYLFRQDRRYPPPLTVPRMIGSAIASTLAGEWNISGPAFTLTSACSSATHAIGLAYHHIRHGLCDAAIVGGSEAILTSASLKAWDVLRAITRDICRPFSRDRSGTLLGEGAGVLVLERYDHACARHAPIQAEVIGYGTSSGASGLTKPNASSFAHAIERALRDAQLNTIDIDYINAHGTGTVLNDRAETEAIKTVFGSHALTVPLSSTKSIIGHTMGAGGALELISTILGMRGGFMPPTLNYLGKDNDCDLDCIPNEARSVPFRTAMSSSFAFGDLNAVLVVRDV